MNVEQASRQLSRTPISLDRGKAAAVACKGPSKAPNNPVRRVRRGNDNGTPVKEAQNSGTGALSTQAFQKSAPVRYPCRKAHPSRYPCPWNHIATAKNSGGTTIATYTYAANGNRITEAAGGTTTGFYYNGPQIIEQRQGSTVTSQNVFNIDYVNDLLLRDDNSTSGSLGNTGSGLGQRLFAQHDANFNVTALTSTSGTVLERYEYSPYGTVTVLNPDGTVRGDGTIASSDYGVLNLFQGMRFDPVTGLYDTPNRELNLERAHGWRRIRGGMWTGAV